MTIDQMMAEIRETHPDARVRRLAGEGGTCAVLESGLSHAGRISQARNKSTAVLIAYRALRATRPKPMTIGQAKEAVRSKHRFAGSHVERTTVTGEPYWWITADGRRNSHRVLGETYPTEGQAWKAATAAIQASEGKS